MLSPQEVGDAALGQLTLGLVFVMDHLVPAAHKFLSWEEDDSDLGPIVPEWVGSGNCIYFSSAPNPALAPLPAKLSA